MRGDNRKFDLDPDSPQIVMDTDTALGVVKVISQIPCD